MRLIFSVLSLLIVVAVVGLLAKRALAPVISPPSTNPAAIGTDAAQPTTPVQRSQQMQQQYKQAIEGAMQPRALPDDK